jgi:hypothetical protein
MRKTLLWTVSLLAACACNAHAAGLNLGWNDCPGGATYALTRTFACNTNMGTNTMVGSFVAPAGVAMMSANEIVIDVKTSAGTFPAWWALGTGMCRAGSLSASFDFTPGPFTCYDYWQGGAVGAILMNAAPVGTKARIKAICALPAGDPRITAVPEGLHVYSFKANLNNARTLGGTCPGCAAEMCIVLNQITINQSQPHPSQMPITNPAVSQHVVWQSFNGFGGCPLATPAKSQTWGSIKALYR